MAELNPFPPGAYPVVVIGSGPGGLQVSHSLARAGIEVATLSADDAPGGMFRRFPLFQRLITWTKPYAPAPRESRAYEWYDWNALLGDGVPTAHPALDGTSYFPTRADMERALAEFARTVPVRARYGCRWESTERTGAGFVIHTSDGDYRASVLVVAVGMTEAWKPPITGLEHVPHYVETHEPKTYADKTVFVIGKRNSGFEIADGLLPWARRIVLASPRPARLSIVSATTAAARARYLQPYEDHILGGGNFVLDASIERVERTASGYRAVLHGTTKPGEMMIEADEVIAATGFTTPMRDLAALGVATFHQGRLPAQTPYWESISVPGIYFAGSITQGAVGLKKYGIPSNSAAVHGFRYNARVLAEHIAAKHFGVRPARATVAPGEVVARLLAEATSAPELWHQQSYLARVLTWEPDGSIVDDGVVPLAHFVDDAGPDAVALAIETEAAGEIHPAVYVRRGGRVSEHTLPPSPLNDYDTTEHRRHLSSLLAGMLGA